MSFFTKKITYTFLILLALFSLANFCFSQQTGDQPLNLTYYPSNPRAGESVTITVNSDSIDLNSSKIVWYVDGVARKETSNQQLIIKNKGDGGQTTVRVIVETQDGIIKETSTTISSSGVDLLIEPLTYAMPFYKGKPFFVAQSRLKIIAIPDIIINGDKAAAKDLDFVWSKDGNVLYDDSGKGKNYVIVDGTIPATDINIGVQVLDDSENVLAENSKIVVKNSPFALFYEDSPLYGVMYNKAITGGYFIGNSEEFNVLAKPFSFSFTSDTASDAEYNWQVNNDAVTPSGEVNVLTFRQDTTNIRSTAFINLNIRNSNKIMQYSNNSFNIEYGE